MKHLFGNVYAPSTVGTLLREFSFGHARQLESVLREHLIALTARVGILPGLAEQAFIDIDSLLRPVYGHAKQGASYGHTKIAGRQILRKGLSPLATTSGGLHADHHRDATARRESRSGKGAGRMVTQAIVTARTAGATGALVVRGDSAYGTRSVISACLRAKVCFSLVLSKNTAVQRESARSPTTRHPGEISRCRADPDTGSWISDAEVAETAYTAFASTKAPVTARLIVRRVKDARFPDALFPVWRYHPFFTNITTPQPTPMSPIAGTRSSKPSSPTSSTGRWRTCRRGASGRTPPGCSARRSPTIAARRRCSCRWWACSRPWGDATPQDRQPSRPVVSTATTTDLAASHALALVGRMARLWTNTIGHSPPAIA